MRLAYIFSTAAQLALFATAQSPVESGNMPLITGYRTCSASLCAVHVSQNEPSTSVTTFTPPGETVTSTTIITVDPQGNPIKPRPTITSTTVVYVNDVAKTKRRERSLSWTNMPAGYTNDTLVVGATAASGSAISGALVVTGASSGTAVHPKVSVSKTHTKHHDHEQPTITVTHRETITETTCPTSTTPIPSTTSEVTSQENPSRTAAVVEVSIDLPGPQSPDHTDSLLATSVTPPPTPESIEKPQTDAPMSTFTAWTTTWHTVIVTVDAAAPVPTSGPANEHEGQPGKPYIDHLPHEPIDQAYGMPASSSPAVIEPNVGSAPNLKSSTSCTEHATATDIVVGPPTSIQTIILGTGTAPGTAFTSPTSQAVPTAPVHPSVPYGHPPSLSSSRTYYNNTVSDQPSSVYQPTAASVSMTAPHLHTQLPVHSETHGEQAKCTTTFQRAQSHPCTSTQYVITATLAIDCHGCVGEQAQPLPAYNENAKCHEPTTTIIPISIQSVCEISTTIAGAAKPTEAHPVVASSGFTTRASASRVHENGYRGSE